MNLTLADYDELYRRTTEFWHTHGTARSWDCHEQRRLLGRFRYAVEVGNAKLARKSVEEAMAHGLPADDVLARCEEK